MLLVCYNTAVWMDLPGTVCIKCGVCVSGFHSAQQLSDGRTEAAVTTNFCLTGCSVCCRRARGTAVCDSRDQWGLLTFSLTSASFFDLGKAALFRQVPKGWRCDPGAHRFLPGPLWCHRAGRESQWCHGEGGDGPAVEEVSWDQEAGSWSSWWLVRGSSSSSFLSFTFITRCVENKVIVYLSRLCFIIPGFTVTQFLTIQSIKTSQKRVKGHCFSMTSIFSQLFFFAWLPSN